MSESIFRAIRTDAPRRALTAAALLLAICLPMLNGCGGGGDGVLATVGDREITETYYKDRLVRLDENELPRGEDGMVLDPASLAAKQAFLDVIINKELMVLQAHELGFDQTEEYQKGQRFISEMLARETMGRDLIEVQPGDVTGPEIEAYYAKRQTKRHFQFIICNFEDDALEARKQILDGGLWEDVAREFNDGSTGPQGDYTMAVQYGMVKDTFEQSLFSIELGEVSQPIDTIYGFWIVRLTNIEEVRERPLDDNYREQIRKVISQRRAQLNEKEFYEASMEKHEFFMDDTALWLVFEGLPEREEYLDPATDQPVSKTELDPLDVPAEESDRVFFSCRFDLDDEPDVWTIGRYKAIYNDMSVFQRPKKIKMLGGVRQKILADMVIRRLQLSEAIERGYMDDPRVTEESAKRLEQIIVERLHSDVVKYEEYVSAADVDAFWAEHSHEYMTHELREGHLILCRTEEDAAAAREALAGGEAWDLVFERYNAGENAVNKGALTISYSDMGIQRDAMFGIEEIGGVSSVFQIGAGWGLTQLDNIVPPVQREKTEAVDEVSQRIKMRRKDEALQTLLDEWRGNFGVVVDEAALEAMPSWTELQSAQ